MSVPMVDCDACAGQGEVATLRNGVLDEPRTCARCEGNGEHAAPCEGCGLPSTGCDSSGERVPLCDACGAFTKPLEAPR